MPARWEVVQTPRELRVTFLEEALRLATTSGHLACTTRRFAFSWYTVWFRDWLRANPEEAARYEAVKRNLAKTHSNDVDYDDYTRAKTAYLDEVQPKFEAWAAT